VTKHLNWHEAIVCPCPSQCVFVQSTVATLTVLFIGCCPGSRARGNLSVRLLEKVDRTGSWGEFSKGMVYKVWREWRNRQGMMQEDRTGGNSMHHEPLAPLQEGQVKVVVSRLKKEQHRRGLQPAAMAQGTRMNTGAWEASSQPRFPSSISCCFLSLVVDYLKPVVRGVHHCRPYHDTRAASKVAGPVELGSHGNIHTAYSTIRCVYSPFWNLETQACWQESYSTKSTAYVYVWKILIHT
jgi:hypothetical protein